jgi:hypothetical protein
LIYSRLYHSRCFAANKDYGIVISQEKKICINNTIEPDVKDNVRIAVVILLIIQQRNITGILLWHVKKCALSSYVVVDILEKRIGKTNLLINIP